MKIKLPKGFKAYGMHCGLKKKRKDLALFYSEKSAKCAALFTTNLVKAAPVIFCQSQLNKTNLIRAVIVNSGNANCMTGKRGLKDAKTMVKELAKVMRLPEKGILVSSTGVIGKPLNMEPIISGIPALVEGLSEDGIVEAAEGIMTTDRFHKISSRTLTVQGKKVSIVGVAKGAGMINPNMATMLAYIMTDVNISEKALRKALCLANEESFNAITVDGDMSTNDTVILLANGFADNRMITENGKDFNNFLKQLKHVMSEIADMIVRDGEGATKFVEVIVKGAKTQKAAKRGAKAIANSVLMKCAVHGGDPNWGRVASAIGSSGIKFDPGRMDVVLDGVVFLRTGRFVDPDQEKKKYVFKDNNVTIEVNLHQGDKEASVHSCDISKKYIAINSYYTT